MAGSRAAGHSMPNPCFCPCPSAHLGGEGGRGESSHDQCGHPAQEELGQQHPVEGAVAAGGALGAAAADGLNYANAGHSAHLERRKERARGRLLKRKVSTACIMR